jgi:hypothetical protein
MDDEGDKKIPMNSQSCAHERLEMKEDEERYEKESERKK